MLSHAAYSTNAQGVVHLKNTQPSKRNKCVGNLWSNEVENKWV